MICLDDRVSRRNVANPNDTRSSRPGRRWGDRLGYCALSAAVLIGLIWVPGCAPTAATKADAGHGSSSAAPSKVTSGVKEADLPKLELTEKAEQRLGVQTVVVERKPVPRVVSYGGEVMIPPGRLISVASPFLGMVEAPSGSVLPRPGVMVTRGQPIVVVKPILSPESRATMAPLLKEADGQVKQAQEQWNIAKINLGRVEKLVSEKLGGAAAVVDARAQVELAHAGLSAAEERRDEMKRIALAPDAGGGMSTLTFKAPVGGVLQNLHAQAGQPVPAGAILFDVAEMDPIWVKVPVYVGDLERLAADKPAGVGGLADPPGMAMKEGRPVVAPGLGDPMAYTVFVYYEVDNKDRKFRPGQRVGVTLPLTGDEESLVIPFSALIRDALGGTWVYENVSPHVYIRRRVFVDRVVGELAALNSGPKAGAKVVTQAAAELYGAEFGGQK